MNEFRVLLLIFLFSSTNPLEVKAQNHEQGIYLTPWAGAFWSHSSGGDLPFVRESGVVEAKMANSPALGVDVELDLPFQPLSVRGSLGLAVFTAVEFSNWDGELSRGTSHVSLGNPQGTGSSVILLTGSAILKPWASHRLPYMLGGIGLKRYNYSNMASEIEGALPSARTRVSFQIGLGLLISHRIRLEISDHISRQNFSFEVPQLDSLPEPVQTQNDFIIALGYRFGPL